MNLKTGHLLAGGRYKVERVLGQGGFGITYEARDTKFKSRVKSVAIKEFFVKDFCNREEETNRIIVATQSKVELVEKLRNKFIDEANALFELEHPGIVRVTDTFEENGTAYYVMEYINGSTLSTIIEKDGPLSEEKALGYIHQAAAALEYLHGQNRLHLDIKPHNIMADNDGRVVLIDFGVSKQYDEVNGENTSTLLGSTPGYAPIEQSGSGVSEFYPSTDIYSLGATLYKLLTGNTPFPAHLLASGETLPPLPHCISAASCKAIESAMSLNRNNRPQSIGEFLSLLDGKSKDKSDVATIVGGSVMNNEILHSAENDKEQKSVISTEHSDGEISSTDAGETVLLTDDELSPSLRRTSNKVAQGVEDRKGLHTDDKKRADKSSKRSFSNVSMLILSVASVLLFVALFFIKSCNDRQTAETEQQRMEERKRGTINGHEYVDLGLSVKWATCNVGASKPEDFGGYYAWGETDEKNNYSGKTYKCYGDTCDIVTKYCIDEDDGIHDNKIVLASEYDVAHVKWGGTWRMPTRAEQDELSEKCKWEWTTINGVSGYRVTGPNGNSIFLPAAGYRYGAETYDRVSYGYYWSSSLSSNSYNYACYLYFNSGYYDWSRYDRYYGLSVRPVSR